MRHLHLLPAALWLCFAQAQAQSIVLTCDKPIELFNDHVGHDWRFGFGVNRTFYPILEPVEAPAASAATLEFIIQEMDDYTDQTVTPLQIDPGKLEYNKQYSRTLEIIVTENAGRYKGHTAKFKVTVYYRKTATKV